MLPQFLAGGFGSLGDGVELLPHGTQRVGEHEPPIAAGLPAQGVVADEVAGLAVAQQFRDARGPVPGERGRSAVHGLRHAQAVSVIRVHQRGGEGLRLLHPPGGVAGAGEGAIAR